MEYIYFELKTGGQTPLYSRMTLLSCVFVNGSDVKTRKWDIRSLSDEYSALKKFSELIKEYSCIACPNEKYIKYISECFREYRIEDDLSFMQEVIPSIDPRMLDIPVFTGELKYYFSNYKDYYYLPLEDTAIHKSVAEFVDKGARVKATPETAYIKKAGTFVPAGNTCKNIFRKDLHDSEAYVLAEDADASVILHSLCCRPTDA